jgi:two-component system response regulator AtoC
VRDVGPLDFRLSGYSLFLINDAGICVVPLPAVGTVAVGRAARADVRIPDIRVSRQHVRIHLGTSFHVEDLHSANGTILTGQPIAGGELRAFRPGDTILVGGTTMLIRGHARSVALIPDPPSAGIGVPGTTDAAAMEPVVGQAMRTRLDLADRAATSMLSVLLLGETGVGKDVLAERIHHSSPRASGPFLRLNCAALSPTLLASELFGHEKGAFTGATSTQPGLLQSASGGTVFFDEIGDLPLDLQAQLLVVLERREVLPVGAVRPRQIDVRFISATNRNLTEDIIAGKFRLDLYHRLNGVTIEVPPLRERVTEIEGLARQFAHRAACSIGRTPPVISEEVLAALRASTWPGNIRELRTVIERAVLLGSEGAITLADIAPAIAPASPATPAETTWERTAASDEQTQIAETLASCGGNQSRAAKLLGISRNTLIARIEKYGLARPLRCRGCP